MADIDPRELRNTLGSFATGITVITARAADDTLVGLTVNSFASVSLDPPLVLWSLSLYSPSLAVFQHCSHYAINVLAADQMHLSQRFSRPSEEGSGKFAGLEFDTGRGGAPLLRDCCAWFECRNETRHPGGDHLIFIGLVEGLQRSERAPLLYHGGRYCSLAAEPQ
jgi:flavin reductase (DIM6/NTAB) family NADH-FMN oxidoreductase RutF